MEEGGKTAEPAQNQPVAMRPGQGVTASGEPQVWITAQQLLESDPGLEPRQRRTQAVVDPMAEPEVGPIAAADVEDIRCRETARVAVGRTQAHQHLLAGGGRGADELHPTGR